MELFDTEYSESSDFEIIEVRNKQSGGKYEKKWKEFKHQGVYFPPKYSPHDIPIIYNNEKVYLNPLAEEYANFYSKYIDSEYVKNNTFNKNFWNDWKKTLQKSTPIKSLDDCDFSLIIKYLNKQKEIRSSRTKEDKQKIKEENDKLVEKYKYATVDGNVEPVGNFRIEPPGIFLGRGCHPLMGKIKKRIEPEDIILNLSKDAEIPKPPEEHQWKEIVHTNDNWWLASWKDNITGKTKYVWLADSSSYKSASDMHKFELARNLKKKINKIRENNDSNLQSRDMKTKQLATALYIIDKLALRVGNEKGKDAADTVGVSSLRVEHIELLDNNRIKLDFLGKDSVRYVNKFTVSELIYENLKLLINNKNSKDQIFDLASPDSINKYLQSFMKKLTSKVFRTFNASFLFQKELDNIFYKFKNYNKNDKSQLIKNEINIANKKVALLCNHQKAVSKNFNEQLKKFDDRINEQNNKKKKLKREINNIRELNTKTSKKSIKTKNKRIGIINLKIKKFKILKESKVELKNVALGTSKINYIDPRIIVAFLKKNNMTIDTIFNTTLANKFQWAMSVDKEWEF
jgi:DNA topoisomerase-1